MWRTTTSSVSDGIFLPLIRQLLTVTTLVARLTSRDASSTTSALWKRVLSSLLHADAHSRAALSMAFTRAVTGGATPKGGPRTRRSASRLLDGLTLLGRLPLRLTAGVTAFLIEHSLEYNNSVTWALRAA